MKGNLRVLFIFYLSLLVGANEIIQAQTPELVIPVGHQKIRPDRTITSLHYSSDDKLILSAGFDLSVKIWEVRTGLLVKTIILDNPVLEAQFIFDNKRIVASTTSVKLTII